MDIETVFLNAQLEEEVYISIPEGLSLHHTATVLQWTRHYLASNNHHGSCRTILMGSYNHYALNVYDPIIACKLIRGIMKYVWSQYVDDLIIEGTDKDATNRIKECLNRRYSVKDLVSINQCQGYSL